MEISNDVLAQKIDSLRELVDLKFKNNEECHNRVENHLTMLNGQTAKNTSFRITQSTINKVLYFVLTVIAVPLFFVFIKDVWAK